MTTVIPIGTHPGLASALVGADLPLAVSGDTVRAVRVFLRATGRPATGSIVASVRNAPGGGGEGIDVTLGDGEQQVLAEGSLDATQLFLRVTAAEGQSENVSGWVELASLAPSITQGLTDLATVKGYIGVQDARYDALLSMLIAGVTERVMRFLLRSVLTPPLQVTEYLDGPLAYDVLRLPHYPVLTVDSVIESGKTLTESTDYWVERRTGLLLRRQNDEAAMWVAGRRNVAVTWNAGYAAAPADLVMATTIQVAYDWRVAPGGLHGGRLGDRGSILTAGGSASYFVAGASPNVTQWAPGVEDVLHRYRDPSAGIG